MSITLFVFSFFNGITKKCNFNFRHSCTRAVWIIVRMAKLLQQRKAKKPVCCPCFIAYLLKSYFFKNCVCVLCRMSLNLEFSQTICIFKKLFTLFWVCNEIVYNEDHSNIYYVYVVLTLLPYAAIVSPFVNTALYHPSPIEKRICIVNSFVHGIGSKWNYFSIIITTIIVRVHPGSNNVTQSLTLIGKVSIHYK